MRSISWTYNSYYKHFFLSINTCPLMQQPKKSQGKYRWNLFYLTCERKTPSVAEAGANFLFHIACSWQWDMPVRLEHTEKGQLEGFKTLLSAADMTKWLKNKDQTILCLEINSLFYFIASVPLSEQHTSLAKYLCLPEGKVLPSMRFFSLCSINFINTL